MNLPILVYARAGIKMYARRGGRKAAASEVKLQKVLVKSGSKANGSIFGIIRYAILFSPTAIRALVYKSVLRRDP